MDFGSKFPILMSIPKMVGCQPQKSRILCPQPNKHLLEWHLDWISRQEKSGFPANMPAGASFSPQKSGLPNNVPAGTFLSPESQDLLLTCPQGLHFSKNSPDFRHHARRGFIFPTKVWISRQHARRGFIFLKKSRFPASMPAWVVVLSSTLHLGGGVRKNLG